LTWTTTKMLTTNPAETQMDLVSIVYSFMLTVGTGQFVINDAQPLTNQIMEVDVETMGLHDNKRYILLIDHGHITQQVRVPLTETECKNPH
jgi:hypothetical protein